MTASLAAEVAAITAEFPPWHAWLSTRKPGEAGPVSVCATRCLPTDPCEPVCKNPDHRVTAGHVTIGAREPGEPCGETLDAATPALLRAKLTARCGVMSARLFSGQDIAGRPVVTLNPGHHRGRPFAVVELAEDGRTYMDISTSAEAYALRDAFQRAGDLLAEAEGAAT